MPDSPIINNLENTSVVHPNEDSYENSELPNYCDNLTAKLGGNYAKIIEYYDSKL